MEQLTCLPNILFFIGSQRSMPLISWISVELCGLISNVFMAINMVLGSCLVTLITFWKLKIELVVIWSPSQNMKTWQKWCEIRELLKRIARVTTILGRISKLMVWSILESIGCWGMWNGSKTAWTQCSKSCLRAYRTTLYFVWLILGILQVGNFILNSQTVWQIWRNIIALLVIVGTNHWMVDRCMCFGRSSNGSNLLWIKSTGLYIISSLE